MDLELCTDSVSGALAADKYGFKRIELCSALSEGGLSPTFGMIRACVNAGTAEVHAMVRSVGGGFTLLGNDMEIMLDDIRKSAEAGAKGVVFGLLNEEQGVSSMNRPLIELSRKLGLEATFHRAFDQVRDPVSAMKQLIDLGITRVLTSGQGPTAIEGIELIGELQQRFGSQVQIMAGSGVNQFNVKELVSTGIRNIHFTARKPVDEAVIPGMGQRFENDEKKIRSILEQLIS